jgi:hypothetical protein
MFKKCKSYIIILLILSLSFVPSVNASNDIFNDQQHLSYNTLKNRIIDYTNTPDYMKSYAPSVIGRDEYIDSSDIYMAVDDLLNILPVDNSTVNLVKNTPLFKNMNTILVNKIKGVREIFELIPEDIPAYLTPYLDNPAMVMQSMNYRNYNIVAHRIQDIISDNLLFEESGGVNVFRTTGDNIIKIGEIEFTCNELFNRIRTADIMPDGNYMLTDLSRLSSGQIPPSIVSVEFIADLTDNVFVIGKPGASAYNLKNSVLTVNAKSSIEIPEKPNEYKTTVDGKYPELIMDRDGENTRIISDNSRSTNTIDHESLRDVNAHPVDLAPANVKANSDELGIKVVDGKVMGERLTDDKVSPFDKVSIAETGLMFVFAIVCFITAWVYR